MGFSLTKAIGGIAKGIVKGAVGAVPGGSIAKGVVGGIAKGFAGSKQQPGKPPARRGTQQPFVQYRESTGVSLRGFSRTRSVVYNPQTGQEEQCIPGTVANRSTYVTRGGGTSRWPDGFMLHERGTECVTPRRINPGNGRAAVRALVRLAAFDRLASKVDRQLRRISHTTRGGRGRKIRSVALCGTCGKQSCSCR